ncbi:MAG TPA: energy transducer TonB [Pseudomonadales bacterium]
MLYHDPAAKTHDRIGFTLSMALALHVAVVLGVGFALQVPKAPSATRMDITLSHYATDKTIVDADFVAQTNQEASGSESEKAELTTTELAPVNSPDTQPLQPVIEMPRQSRQRALEVVTTTADSPQLSTVQPPEPDVDDDMAGDRERLQRMVEIASLQAKLDEEQQLYARLPRIRRATSVATRAADDAEYLFNWQRRIETIGNQHYPARARSQKLFGDVRVLVAINADGSLRDAQILQSSGSSVLDEAALRIVRLASPFEPFPQQLRRHTDVLEIVRTWQFRQNRFSRLD